MKRHTYLLLLLLVPGLLFLLSCKGSPKEREAEESDSPQPVLTARQQKFADLQIGYPSKRTVSRDIPARGHLIEAPNARVMVSARYQGLVEEVRVTLGQKVKKGTILAYLGDVTFIDLQQEYLTVNRQIPLLKKIMEDKKALVDQGVKTQKELMEDQMAYQHAFIQLKALEEKLKWLGIDPKNLSSSTIKSKVPLKAPMDGIVIKGESFPGAFVHPGTSLFEIVDPSNLLVELFILEKDACSIHPQQEVTLELSNLGPVTFKGKILSLAPRIEKGTRFLKILVQPSEEIPMGRPGMFVSGMIHSESHISWVIPESAVVLKEEDTPVLYTLVDSSGMTWKFKELDLKLGLKQGDFQEIKDMPGLSTTLPIVVNGAYYLKAMGEN